MSNVRKLIERFKSLNVDDISGQAITDTKDELIIRNQAQMYEGQKADGSPLESFGRSTYAWKTYADEKYRMNPLAGYGNKDHYNTGSYYRGMYATVQGSTIKMGSTDSKANDLETGGEYGLNNEHKADYIKEHLKPRFVLLIAEKTGLPFK
jgi:hypothetical protein